MSAAKLATLFNRIIIGSIDHWKNFSVLTAVSSFIVHCLIAFFKVIPCCCAAYVIYSIYLFITQPVDHSIKPIVSLLSYTSWWPAMRDTPVPFFIPWLLHMALFFYCLIECLFIFYLTYRCAHLQKRRAPPPLSKEYREIFIRRVLIAICSVAEKDPLASLVHDGKLVVHQEGTSEKSKDKRRPERDYHFDYSAFPPPTYKQPTLTRALSISAGRFDARKILQGWFYNAPIEQIYEENVVQWLAFGLFHRDPRELNAKQTAELRSLWKFLQNGGQSREERDNARLSQQNALFYSSHEGLDRSISQGALDVRPPELVNDPKMTPPTMNRSISSLSPTEIEQGFPIPAPNVNITPGFNPAVKCMRIIIDPIQYEHRPLMLYGIVEGLGAVFARLLKWRGFEYYSSSEVSYFHRPPLSKTDQTLAPVVFIHGISNGISSYSTFLYRLNNSGNRHIFLMHVPYVSMRITEHVPTAAQTVEGMKKMLDSHIGPKQRAILIGHSYGSLLCSWFIKAHPSRVKSTILVDPVCFMLFLPHLCYNFMYRKPTTPMHHILHYFTARELYISHTLHRHFFWPINVLWVEDLTYIGEDEQEPGAEDDTRSDRQHGENWNENQNCGNDDESTNSASCKSSRSRSRSIDGSAQLPNATPVTPRGNLRRGNSKDRSSHSSHSIPDDAEEEPNSMLGPELILNAVMSPLIRPPRSISKTKHSRTTRHAVPPSCGQFPTPSRCYVFLSEDDDIIYTPPIMEYLRSTATQLAELEIETTWREQCLSARSRSRMDKSQMARDLAASIVQCKMWPKYRHAQFLISARAQTEVMSALEAVSWNETHYQ